MKRKVYEDILKWKNESNGKTALLIEGARRVGKSYIAEKFAKENYTFSSLNKLNNKYKEYLGQSIIIHTKDLKEEDGILYIPIYMTEII